MGVVGWGGAGHVSRAILHSAVQAISSQSIMLSGSVRSPKLPAIALVCSEALKLASFHAIRLYDP